MAYGGAGTDPSQLETQLALIMNVSRSDAGLEEEEVGLQRAKRFEGPPMLKGGGFSVMGKQPARWGNGYPNIPGVIPLSDPPIIGTPPPTPSYGTTATGPPTGTFFSIPTFPTISGYPRTTFNSSATYVHSFGDPTLTTDDWTWGLSSPMRTPSWGTDGPTTGDGTPPTSEWWHPSWWDGGGGGGGGGAGDDDDGDPDSYDPPSASPNCLNQDAPPNSFPPLEWEPPQPWDPVDPPDPLPSNPDDWVEGQQYLCHGQSQGCALCIDWFPMINELPEFTMEICCPGFPACIVYGAQDVGVPPGHDDYDPDNPKPYWEDDPDTFDPKLKYPIQDLAGCCPPGGGEIRITMKWHVPIECGSGGNCTCCIVVDTTGDGKPDTEVEQEHCYFDKDEPSQVIQCCAEQG
jgi:hypothetical protein